MLFRSNRWFCVYCPWIVREIRLLTPSPLSVLIVHLTVKEDAVEEVKTRLVSF